MTVLNTPNPVCILQETEEKLRQSVAQVTEREEQIHQLQGELQDTEKVKLNVLCCKLQY